MRDASMDAWANAMTLTANTEAYARATGAMLDASLTASIPLRQIIENAMGQALQQYNLPSRADFISLAERLTQIETAIDDLDAKFDLPLDLALPSQQRWVNLGLRASIMHEQAGSSYM